MSMNANRRAKRNNEKTSKVLEKLSSGRFINRAADDAAGLSISEKLRANIAGLDKVVDIEDNAINMCSIADGALQEDDNMLKQIVHLLEKSLDGIQSREDKVAIQLEIDELVEQIDDIAKDTHCNGVYPLLGQNKSIPWEEKEYDLSI